MHTRHKTILGCKVCVFVGFFYWLDHKAISCSEPEFFFEPYIGYVARNVQHRKCWVHLSRHKPNSVFLPPLIQINKALLRKKNLLSNRPNCFSKSKRSTQPNVLLISTTPTEVFFSFCFNYCATCGFYSKWTCCDAVLSTCTGRRCGNSLVCEPWCFYVCSFCHKESRIEMTTVKHKCQGGHKQ